VAFSLINVWAVGDVLTSAQMNSVAVDLTKALDKSISGDTLSGVITMANTASIQASNAANIVATAADAIAANAASGIVSNVAGGINGGVLRGIIAGVFGGITGDVAGGIQASVAGGIQDGGVAGGIQATVAGGIVSTVAFGIEPGVAAGIRSNISGGIFISIAAGLSTGVANGINLGGGATDTITYSTGHTYSRFQPAITDSGASGWLKADNSGILIGPATTQQIGIPLPHLLNGAQNGATLTAITIVMAVLGAHTGVPATMPSIALVRYDSAGGAPLGTGDSLFSSSPKFVPTPGSAAAWVDSGNIQQFSFTPDQNNVIDLTRYRYVVLLIDEHGANAVSGNNYYGFITGESAIMNMAL
jgi:hypothetical protein